VPTRGSISLYNIAGLISEVSEELATQIGKNGSRRHATLIWGPRKEAPLRMCACTLYFQKNWSNWSTFFSLLVWVYPYSNLCNGLQKRIFSAPERVFAVQGHPWGRWFWYQSKARMQLPISLLLGLWSYLAPILRYGDLLAKIAYFSYRSLIQRPRSLCCLWNFGAKLTVRKLESCGYPPVRTAWSGFGMIPVASTRVQSWGGRSAEGCR